MAWARGHLRGPLRAHGPPFPALARARCLAVMRAGTSTWWESRRGRVSCLSPRSRPTMSKGRSSRGAAGSGVLVRGSRRPPATAHTLHQNTPRGLAPPAHARGLAQGRAAAQARGAASARRLGRARRSRQGGPRGVRSGIAYLGRSARTPELPARPRPPGPPRPRRTGSVRPPPPAGALDRCRAVTGPLRGPLPPALGPLLAGRGRGRGGGIRIVRQCPDIIQWTCLSKIMGVQVVGDWGSGRLRARPPGVGGTGGWLKAWGGGADVNPGGGALPHGVSHTQS